MARNLVFLMDDNAYSLCQQSEILIVILFSNLFNSLSKHIIHMDGEVLAQVHKEQQ